MGPDGRVNRMTSKEAQCQLLSFWFYFNEQHHSNKFIFSTKKNLYKNSEWEVYFEIDYLDLDGWFDDICT